MKPKRKKGDSDMASYYDSWINDLKDELATAPDEYPAAGDYTGDTFIGSIGDTRFTVSTPSEKNGTTGYSLYLADDFLKYRPRMEQADVIQLPWTITCSIVQTSQTL